jgi:DNA polymerase-3 subunit epsilon
MANEFISVAGFDCETTGTDPARDRIVSAALVRRIGGSGRVAREWLIDPGVEIAPGAVAVHGITTEHARAHGLEPGAALDEIAGALAACLAEGIPLLIFNAAYDLRILDAELARYGLDSLAERVGGPVRPVIDPYVIDRGVDRYRKGKRTLADVMAVYDVPPSDRLHDATEDVDAAIAVFDAIRDRYPELPGDLGRLHDWQVVKHKEWAVNFNQWLESRGRTPDVDTLWP